eukprot:jgi/Undpi1/3483/HiC_scaffold_16.g06855.m1
MARIGCAPPTAGAGSKYCGGTSALIGSGGASMVRSNTYGVFRELHAPSSADSSSPLEIARVPVECGVVSPMRTVPDHIPKTPYYADGEVPPADNTIHLHTAESLVPMREACVLARDMLDLCCAMAQPGVTTDAIDAAVHAAIVEAGGCPSPLNYHGFPKSVCSSVNEVACHAIPDNRPLRDGDLVSFDVSVFFKARGQMMDGFHGDNCATVGVGTIDAASQRLMDATQEAMMEGVSVCRPGACLTEIGSAIHAVADRYGFDTVRKYCGHGVGSSFHMLPFVEHFRNKNRLELVPGMTFTIEPIFTEGSEATTTWSDGWTVQTRDGGRAAQFEHVVLITEDGHEVLTVPSRKK